MFDWPGSAAANDLRMEYTGACIPVYDLTIVFSMVENIYPHPRSVQHHSLLRLKRGIEMCIFGSGSDRDPPHTSTKSTRAIPNDGLLSVGFLGGKGSVFDIYNTFGLTGTHLPVG